MAKQLVQRPFAATPALGDNSQVAISPNGNWLLVCNENATPSLYKWSGTTYVAVTGAIPNTAGKTISSGDWSEDGLFLVLQTNTNLQLRSFNDTTGATVILDDVAPSRSGATVRHFFGDHYVGIKTRASSGTIAEWYRHDRTTNTLTRRTSYTSGTSSSIMSFAVMKNKKSLLIAWRNLNGNGIRVTYFNESSGVNTFGTLVALESIGATTTTRPVDVAVSDDENYFFRVGDDNLTWNRAGTIAANGQSLSVAPYDSVTLGTPASLTGFIFSSDAVFRGSRVLSASTYDTYNIFNDGTYTENLGEILPIDGRASGFGKFNTSGSKANSKTPAKVWVFLSEGSPSVAVYEEVISDDQISFFASTPMADAFTVMQKAETITIGDISPMGNSWVITDVPHVVNAQAEAPMGDAWFVNVGQNSTNIAIAPLGEATFDIPNSFYEFTAEAPMGDAWFVTDFNTNELFALAPIGDATITFTPAWILADAVAPMGDASFDIPNVYVESLTAEAPMGDASFDIPNVYVRALFALAPKGDAWFTTQLGDYRFVALAPLGDASVSVSVPNTVDIIAAAPMGDAGIGLDEINLICRRRSMMIIQVL